MEHRSSPRARVFLKAVSWTYLVLSAAMIGFAVYSLTSKTVSLTFGGVTDAVFSVIGGLLGFVAGIFGLVSKNMKRCRLLGLILLALAAIPLAINLLAKQPFAIYWKNIAVMILPFLYLLAALLKRSEKNAPAEDATVTEELKTN